MKKHTNAVLGAVAAVFAAPVFCAAQQGSAIAPKFLFEAQNSAGKITGEEKGVSVANESGALVVEIAPNSGDWPGFNVSPANGDAFDLSPWGNISMRVTNLGEAQIGVALRADNPKAWESNPQKWNTEQSYIKPGETKEIKVIFGYHYGFQKGFALDSSKVANIKIFALNKSDKIRKFRIEDLQAGGARGDTPPDNPGSYNPRPKDGRVLGAASEWKYAPKFEGRDGAVATLTQGRTVTVAVQKPAAGKSPSVSVKPGLGTWDFGLQHAVSVTIKNTGDTAITPKFRADSGSGNHTDTAAAAEPLAPGKSVTLAQSFVPAKHWVGIPEPKAGHGGGIDGTGTKYESYRTRGVTVFIEPVDSPAAFEITEIKAIAPPAATPSWLGKKPPVDGEWKLTLDENFDGSEPDLKLWNLYTPNYWDKRTHFTKDNVVIENGKAAIRYSKTRGFHNDNLYPEIDKSASNYETDFACGFLDSYGKWTQTYGYFEARMKIPAAHGLWPAFWMMPDRGGDPDHAKNPQWVRASTGKDKTDGEFNGKWGAEIDIMENLSGWGPYRFNIAMHWDGYGKEHKAIGSTAAYVPGDEDGFITVGFLWTPGKIAFYGNGRLFGEWENERVPNVPCYPILYMVSGGWANTPLNPEELPSDFVVDYVRAWQRADLATPGEGAIPNDGKPRSQF